MWLLTILEGSPLRIETQVISDSGKDAAWSWVQTAFLQAKVLNNRVSFQNAAWKELVKIKHKK